MAQSAFGVLPFPRHEVCDWWRLFGVPVFCLMLKRIVRWSKVTSPNRRSPSSMMSSLFFLFWQASGHRTSQNHVLRHHRQNRLYHYLILYWRGVSTAHCRWAHGMEDAGEVGEGPEPITIDKVDGVSEAYRAHPLRTKGGLKGGLRGGLRGGGLRGGFEGGA